MKNATLSTVLKYSALFSLVGTSYATQATEWNADLGLSVLGAQSHVFGEEDKAEIRPYVNLEYGMFIAGPEGIGISSKVGEIGQLSAVLLMRESVVDRDDNDLLKHFEKRKDATELAIQWTHFTPFIDITTALSSDVSETHEGYEAKLMLSKKLETDVGTFIPAFAIHHQSEELVDYYYGVRAAEESSRFSAYQGKAATNANTSVTHVYPLSAEWHVATRIAYDYLGRGISDSPIVEESGYWSGALSMFYRF
ncbi:MipA/OmpV family protein [Marinomonas ostreistagni]|uniref:MipA/OmpV family protein n=1 Tax=Marinomonas ostreistagni TaxID=359209 RepID=A0ABS0ZAB6_9GAMM|nr:MipA/OmpV family protein [Marinomonas ostreistagni]MBJ7550591.1 MipA/OmpV family protein [Marinomonas ostreistagni]